MRRVSLVLLGLLLFMAPMAHAALDVPSGDAEPHRSSEDVKKALSTVIESQLAAFRANDYAKAYTFAADEIRGSLSIGQFETMVKSGYPVIASSTSAQFGLTIDTGDEAVVTVRVLKGVQSTSYQYHMIKQKGVWHVGGVTEVEASGLTV